MSTRWQCARTSDEGVALLFAIALIGLAGVLITTLVGLGPRVGIG